MEGKYIKQRVLSPNWLPGGNTFWYRRYLSPGKFEFIFVDAVSKERRSAFDHEKLAEALKSKVDQPDPSQEIGAHSLPFNWIDITPDGSSVRFPCRGKKWIFNQDCNLEEWNGEFDQPKSQLLSKERPSGQSSQPVTVNFVNHTDGILRKYWIDWDGKPKQYGRIGPGQTNRQKTFADHVWRLVSDESEEVKTIYVAPEEGEDSVIIDDSTMGDAARQDESKEGSKEDSEAKEDSKNEGEEIPHYFVQDDFNVWVRLADNQEHKLSSNGSESNPYDPSGIYTSPDKKFAVVWQYIPEQEHTIHLREFAPADQLEPKVHTHRYLKPGDRVRVDRPRLFSLQSRSEVSTVDALFQNPYKMHNIGWSPDGSEYRFLFNERGHQNLRVIGLDTSGNVRALVSESSETFIDYSQKLYYQVIEGTDELLWTSERDGFHHLYLFDLKKEELKNKITQGNWNVHSIVSVDEENRQIWFKGYGMVVEQDPYHAHLARVNFDGTGFKVLTVGDGKHRWAMSPDNRYFVDTWSRVDLPPQSVLRSQETGEQLVHLEGTEDAINELSSAGWFAPERFTAPGRDGETPIYGIIIRPSKFDPSKKYPILEDIYAGPQGFSTPKAFSLLSSQRKWADQGYVVVMLDGMGTNWRSKKFHDVCYKNLKDAGFPDRIAWIKAAAETRPWMDTSRVGLFGGSAGGQNAVAALLYHSDFYKAAVADSGCHDNRMDKIWWSEQWMGYPVDKSYEDSSNVVHASKLEGALMLIVGDLDDNVDPASTFQLVKALNEADKDYEFLFIPGGEHVCGRKDFALRRQQRFFRRHLIDS